jgi:polyadenylation factor subunit 2
MMAEYAVLRGHQKEVSALKWHPIQDTLLLSGGFNGTLIYWVMGYSVSSLPFLLLSASQGPHTIVSNAHNYSVNVIAWHPLGHCVATSANGSVLTPLSHVTCHRWNSEVLVPRTPWQHAEE